MNNEKINVSFNWIDDECASIKCPYCHSELVVNIDSNNKCDCGHQFILQQRIWVEEIK